MGTCGLHGWTISEIAAAWKALPADEGYARLPLGQCAPLGMGKLYGGLLDVSAVRKYAGLGQSAVWRDEPLERKYSLAIQSL